MDPLEEGPSEQEEGVQAGSRKRIKVSVTRQEMRSHNRRERERRERQRRERLVEVRIASPAAAPRVAASRHSRWRCQCGM